jgi:hypothetical protein
MMTGEATGFTSLFHEPFVAPLTDDIICMTELKLQSPLMPMEKRASSNQGYWSLAVAKEILNNANYGNGLTFSGFVDKPLLSSHNAPLPLFQVRFE